MGENTLAWPGMLETVVGADGLDSSTTNHNVAVGLKTGETSAQSDAEFEAYWDYLAEGRDIEAEADDALDPLAQEDRFDDRVERLIGIMNNRPAYREILYKTLAFCQQRQLLPMVESEVAGYPGFESANQNPWRLISYLVDGEGLEVFELDETGETVTPEMKEGLSEDEIDDLVAQYALETSDVGDAALEAMAPRKRMTNLFEVFPDRASVYVDLLDFCREPRPFEAIEGLLKNKDLSDFTTMNPLTSVKLKPAAFIEHLEKTGGIVWNDGWILTNEGKGFLEAYRNISS